MLLEYHQEIGFGKKSVEFPRMINLLIDDYRYRSEYQRAVGLQLPLPSRKQFLLEECERMLPAISSLDDIYYLAQDKKDYRYFPSDRSRVVILATARCLLEGNDFLNCLSDAEIFLNQRIENKIKLVNFAEEKEILTRKK